MSTFQQRSAQGLNRALALFGIRTNLAVTDHEVIVPADVAQQVQSAISHVEGGYRVPFIRSLLRAPNRADIALRGDEPRHLMRALEDVHRQQRRNEQIDRGQIPGVLSGAEVSRIIRKHPQMFTGRTPK